MAITDSNSYPDLEVQNDKICHRGACHSNHEHCGTCKIHYELVRDMLQRNLLQYEKTSYYEVVQVFRIDNPMIKHNFEQQRNTFFNSTTQPKIQSKAELSVRARNHFREYFFRTSLTGTHIRDGELYKYICEGMTPTCKIPAELQNFIRKFLREQLFSFDHVTFQQLFEFIHQFFPSLVIYLPTNIQQMWFRTCSIEECFELFNLGFQENKGVLVEELKNIGYRKEKIKSQSNMTWRKLVQKLETDIEENPNTLLTFMNNRPSDAHEIRWAWHGTSPDNISTIASDNFDPAYMKRQVHGKGFYFSPNPNVAIQYAPALEIENEEHHALLLCQVLLGQSAPSRKNNVDSNTYKDFCYAVPNINQINPCYVVSVKKRFRRRRRNFKN